MKKIFMVLLMAAALSTVLSTAAYAGEVVVGAAPGETERPVASELDRYMSDALQAEVWRLSGLRGLTDEARLDYYCFLIGLAEVESEFSSGATNTHSSGLCDRGMWQVNDINVPALIRLGYIQSKRDLYEPFACARCAEYILWQGYQRTGYSEQSYTWYLYGDHKSRSNQYTQRAWRIIKKWHDLLAGSL